MAAATGLAVANVYYNQPLIGLIEAEFGSDGSIYLVPAATLLGFAAGLVVLVPLGDSVDRKKLILWQIGFLIISLIGVSMASTPGLLLLSSLALGAASTIAQQIIPFASDLSPSESRGRTVGTVMSGLLTGILLARTFSGFLGEYFGWRMMFLIGAFIALCLGCILAISLPNEEPKKHHTYKALLLSLLDLARSQPSLRKAIIIQGCLFAGFSAFWSSLSLLLQAAPFYLGSHISGLFGIVGLTGILISPLAGKSADRNGPDRLVRLGIITVFSSFIVLAISVTIPGLIIGSILLDAGLMMAMIANQTIIFSLVPESRSRINTVYMTGLFLCGASGAAMSGVLWGALGWRAVSVMGAVLALLAISVHMLSTRDSAVSKTH